jgi:hypothetical protein
MQAINENEHSKNEQPISPSRTDITPRVVSPSQKPLAVVPIRPKPTLKPLLQYFTIHNPAAEEEYMTLASPAISSFLQSKGYDKVSLMMMHVGFDRGNALPSVLVTAMFHGEDMKELKDLFAKLGCKVLRRIYRYIG